MLLWDINFTSWFLRHVELQKCSSDNVEWCLSGLICSSWTSIKIGRFLGQSHLYCRYLVLTIFYVLIFLFFFLIFIEFDILYLYFDIQVTPMEFFVFILIFLVLPTFLVFCIIDVMMNFILRLKYVEQSKMTEPVLKSLLFMIFVVHVLTEKWEIISKYKMREILSRSLRPWRVNRKWSCSHIVIAFLMHHC